MAASVAIRMRNKNSSNQTKICHIKFIWNGIDIEFHRNYASYSACVSVCSGGGLDLDKSICIKFLCFGIVIDTAFCRVYMIHGTALTVVAPTKIATVKKLHFQSLFSWVGLNIFPNATPNPWTIVLVDAFVLDCRPIHHSLRIVFAIIVTAAAAALFLYRICLHRRSLRFHWNWCI